MVKQNVLPFIFTVYFYCQKLYEITIDKSETWKEKNENFFHLVLVLMVMLVVLRKYIHAVVSACMAWKEIIW